MIRLPAVAFFVACLAYAQPSLTLPNFEVRTVVSGLSMPTSMVFLGPTDFLVLEKATGRVLRVRNDRVDADPVLDLSVNSASERGLLGIALHPDFPNNPGVYLYWTCRSSQPGTVEGGPSEQECDTSRMTGVEDTTNTLSVPLRGNRVDRFTWDGTRLTFDRNIVALRSFQADGASTPAGQGDEGQQPAGNHDGGVITFGPDGKLYIFFGDQGRRGLLQNLADGPTAAGTPDDQFGGPDPDNSHLSGVILRLNPDGTAPEDNPFGVAASRLTGAAADNLRKVFAFGFRNSFGMAFDPFSGSLWMSEHGDDTFDELNMVRAGMNGGWVQVAGPLSRLSEFRQIESTFVPANQAFPALQQWRWPPSRIATTAAEAQQRFSNISGSLYADPQFSWRWAFLPTALGFAPKNFGRSLAGQLIVAASGNPMGSVGYLMRFPMHMNRRLFEFESSGLADRVADNTAKYDPTESEELIIGSGFGIVTDLKQSPRNTLYAVSLSRGTVYEIARTGPPLPEDDDPDIDGIGQPLTGNFTSPSGATGASAPSGTVQVRLNSARELFCYDVNSTNVTTTGDLTLRQAAAGADTAVLEFRVAVQGPSSGCIKAGASLIHAIRGNPGEFYVSPSGFAMNEAPAIATLR